ncbi:MAG: CoA transferase [Devosia sp.]
MSGILSGLRVVEGSAFVAAPLGGMTLAQLGADVIRYDQIGGGLDHGRWPLAPNGQSLFWAGLNKGKRSIQIDLRNPEGQELVARLITAPGEGGGIFVTNLPPRGALAYEPLRSRRADLIMVQLTGNPDGSSEVDYTVNAAAGFLSVTGPRDATEPVNAVLPTWDIAMGEIASVGILAAERHRRLTGQGTLVSLALSDVAIATASALGRLAQAQLGTPATRDGNFLYGAFGRDFVTGDGRRIMLVGLTDRQWKALVAATQLDTARIERATGEDVSTAGGRFAARDAIAAALAPWVAARSLQELRSTLDAAGAAWAPYRDFVQMLAEDPRASAANPMLAPVSQAGVEGLLAAGSPLSFSVAGRQPPQREPKLGEHTDQILLELGLSDGEIASLHDRGVVAGLAGD